jgi:hypothetical protein
MAGVAPNATLTAAGTEADEEFERRQYWKQKTEEERLKKREQDLLFILHLIPQLHDLDLDPSLPLMFQDSLIRFSMNRRSSDFLEVIRVIRLSLISRRTLSNLKIGRVLCNISIRAPIWSALVTVNVSRSDIRTTGGI